MLDAAGMGTWEATVGTGKTKTDLLHDRIFGYPEGISEWGLETLRGHILPDERYRLDEAFDEIFEDGVFDLEAPVRWPDGSVHWIHDRGYVDFDENGWPRKIAGITVEVTDQKQTEIALRKSKERYRTLFNSIDEGFCIIEVIFDDHENPVDFRFLKTNPAFEKHTGLSNVEGELMRYIVPDNEDYWFEIYGKVVKSREPVRFENPARALGYYYDVYAFPLGEPDSNTVGVLFSDISDRKKTELALRDAEKRLRLATKAAGMYVCEVNLVNKVFEWQGKVPHEISFPMPETFEEAEGLLHPEDKKRVVSTLAGVAEHDGNFELEYRVIDPGSKDVIWVYSAGTALRDQYGEYSRIVSIVKNITGRKWGEIRDQFLADLSRKLQLIEDPDKIMQTTASMLGEFLGVDRCTYAEAEEDGNHLNVLGSYRRKGISEMNSYVAMSSFGEEALSHMRQNKAFIVNDAKLDNRISKKDYKTYKRNNIGATICVPLHKDGKFIAKIAVHQESSRKWETKEIELIKTIVHRCWEAIQRVRVTRQLKEMNETLEERVDQRTKEVRKQEERFRKLVEASSQMVWTTNA